MCAGRCCELAVCVLAAAVSFAVNQENFGSSENDILNVIS